MLWREIWDNYKGRIFGIAGGVFLGFIYLLYGFWDMLFFALVVFIGYTLGRRSDHKLASLFSWREWGNWLNDRWRPFK
ncbi:DUF2273 domain-containing protein [Paenibacillus sp. JX-17]|uniref:DUF2273 domain-containing protein n=1 Tax=Paenibacillus lacisoli TaxID=3064525 RepID=A0ABT9C7C4_9BACL|nr:DUF2273 domain-containing protein [Paenibacillus sp. JX-17]MDO7905163.1 DUF2273 domain-containing protein [Paenibacillus sp. JX-17]